MIDRTASFSDRQSAMIRRAAKALPINHRADFVSRVTRMLGPEPSDIAVGVAINRALFLTPAPEDSIR